MLLKKFAITFSALSAILVLSGSAYGANPYLPFDEYIPDCEPRVFNDRVYIYGSHDLIDVYGGGCAGNYEAWSAPVDDLDNWTYEGVLYDKTKDPGYQEGMNMLASDCVEKDGFYYLYYSPVMNTDGNKIAVAKSDSPAGPFDYYGEVAYEDGTVYDNTFDPAVLVDDDGRNYLYSGGESSVVELDDDMLTIIGEPTRLVPRADEDASSVGCITNPEDLEGHAFYEGSSIRKINGTYYLSWANEQICQLSYATSDSPTGPYTYRGVIISNDGKMTEEDTAVYPYGNIHGGLIELNGQWYTFYHRQTNGVESRFWSARQGCADKIEFLEDGSIRRAEMTSIGLSDSPLDPYEENSSFLACYLKPKDEAQTSNNGYGPYTKQFAVNLHGISNLTNNSAAGFKYFDFGDNQENLTLTMDVRTFGQAGCIAVYLDAPNDTEGQKIGEIVLSADDKGDFHEVSGQMEAVSGEHALYFVFSLESEDENTSLCDIANFQFTLPTEE